MKKILIIIFLVAILGFGAFILAPAEGAPVCGNGEVEEGETCDDGNEICGDGIVQRGTFCNDTCTFEVELSERCDTADIGYCVETGTECTTDGDCASPGACIFPCTNESANQILNYWINSYITFNDPGD